MRFMFSDLSSARRGSAHRLSRLARCFEAVGRTTIRSTNMKAKIIPPDPETFIARLRALRDLIEKSADVSEEATQLSDEVIDALERVELFKMLAPRAVGGMEAHPLLVIDALRTLSYFDGSTGWYCQAAVTGPAVAGAFSR
jgi:alkylation response protein AidB-like acyl-CoA dehydrogenase